MERQDGEKQREEKRKRVMREGMSSQPEQSVPLSQESQHSGKAGTHQVGRTRVRETETRSEVPSPDLPTLPSLSVLRLISTYP